MSLFDAFSYRSKRALVVGGATGMGAAVAELVRDAGAEVVVMDRAKVVSEPEGLLRGSRDGWQRRSPPFRRFQECCFARWPTSWCKPGSRPGPSSRVRRRGSRRARRPTCASRCLRTVPCLRGRLRYGGSGVGLRCALQASETAFDLLAPLVGHVLTLRHAIQGDQPISGTRFRRRRPSPNRAGGRGAHTLRLPAVA